MALMRGSSDDSWSQSTGLATASLGQCLPPQEQLLGSRHHEFRFEVKLPLKFFEWHRGPKRLHRDDAAFQFRVALPSKS
jgi:hypothetical protein